MAPLYPAAPLIAVVEDDPEIRELLDLLLTEEGYRTLLLPVGWDAPRIVRETRPALVIMDLWLETGDAGLNALAGEQDKTGAGSLSCPLRE